METKIIRGDQIKDKIFGEVKAEIISLMEEYKKNPGIAFVGFSCVPLAKYNIPLHVLLEKRMACGIGVCLSCVCRKKENNNEKYVRVCTDGPLFNADDIVWD